MNMATGEEMSDLEFNARRDLPAFDEFPWFTRWTGRQARAARGLPRRRHRQRLQRPRRRRVQFEHARHPVHGLRTPPRGRRRVEHQPVPRHPRRHDLESTYEYNFEKNYPWTEYFGTADRGAGLPRARRRRSTACGRTLSFNSDLKTRDVGRRDRSVWHLDVRHAPTARVESDANAVVNAVGMFANPKFVDFAGQRELRRHRSCTRTQWRRRLRRSPASRSP